MRVRRVGSYGVKRSFVPRGRGAAWCGVVCPPQMASFVRSRRPKLCRLADLHRADHHCFCIACLARGGVAHLRVLPHIRMAQTGCRESAFFPLRQFPDNRSCQAPGLHARARSSVQTVNHSRGCIFLPRPRRTGFGMGFFIEIYPDGRNIHEEAEGENGARTRPESRNKKNYAGAGHESDRIVSPRKSGMGSVSPAFPVHSFATGFIRYGIKGLIHPSTSSTCAGSDPVSSKNRLRLRATRERGRESKGSSCYSSLGST